MRKLVVTSWALCVAWFSVPAVAQTELAQSKNCVNCHANDKQLVGPTYVSIAARYKGDKEARDRLAIHIAQGSSGMWGKYAMPANPQVSAEEAKKLAAWVLEQK
ncbi:cytochrome C' [Rhodoferax lacus]|uniref:Cytochrome C n=1 Tax=Rhodoferax lacus TaxID=2184758 RepID=A0A3E1RG20_9BURK|nr:c-type cytochrome [Rhodoferax lacus]RFO98327.1 cytochrome C' [Rhodoferax lacus]